jgi:hypothetical protein
MPGNECLEWSNIRYAKLRMFGFVPKAQYLLNIQILNNLLCQVIKVWNGPNNIVCQFILSKSVNIDFQPYSLFLGIWF